VAAGALPDGTPVIISGGSGGNGGRDGAVRVWRMADGTPVGEPLTGHDGPVYAVAAGALPYGTPVIISGGYDGTVRVWRMADGTPVGEPLTGHDGMVTAVAAGALPDGAPVIISSGWDGTVRDGTVRVWSTADGTAVGAPLTVHGGSVQAVAAGVLPDGAPVIISGDSGGFGVSDGMVRVWQTADGTPVGAPLSGHAGLVTAVAAGTLPDGTPVIISGGNDGTVRVWRMADGTPVGAPLTGHDRVVGAVAAGALPDGTPVVISGGSGGSYCTVQVWRTADGTPVGEPLTGHDRVYAVAAGALPDGTPVVISGGSGAAVWVWRTADGTLVGEPLEQGGSVYAVAAGALPDGTPVIISGGSGGFGASPGSVRVWRTADGALVGEPPTGHIGPVYAVAAEAQPDGTPVIISGGHDGTVRVWRTADGTPLVPPLVLPESVRAAVADHGNVIITATGADIAVHQLALPRPVR